MDMDTVRFLDFIYRDELSIILVEPLTKPAKRWAKENLILQGYQKIDGWIAIDPPMFEDIREAMTGAGLTLENINGK